MLGTPPLWGSEIGGSLGFCGCQPSSSFWQRCCFKGARQRVREQNSGSRGGQTWGLMLVIPGVGRPRQVPWGLLFYQERLTAHLQTNERHCGVGGQPSWGWYQRLSSGFHMYQNTYSHAPPPATWACKTRTHEHPQERERNRHPI